MFVTGKEYFLKNTNIKYFVIQGTKIIHIFVPYKEDESSIFIVISKNLIAYRLWTLIM